jgi:hypothetical protein
LKLWEACAQDVRCAIAEREDLEETLTAEILRSDTVVLESWLKKERTREYLERVPAGVSQELDRALSWQQNLPEGTAVRLAESEDPSILKALMHGRGLTPKTRGDILGKWLTQNALHSSNMGESLLEIIGDDVVVWSTILSVIGAAQSGIILHAARSYHTHEGTAQLAARALLRAAREVADEQHGSRRDSITADLVKAAEALERSPLIDAETYQTLAKEETLAAVSDTLERRSEMQTAELIHMLGMCSKSGRCSEAGRPMVNHATVLSLLSLEAKDVDLPSSIADSVLQHVQELLPRVTVVLGRAAGRGAEVVEKAVHSWGSETTLELIESIPDILDGVTALPTSIVVEAAERGYRGLLRYAGSGADRALILENFRPIDELLESSVYSAMASRLLSGLKPLQCDTAFRLLGEWAGSLGELVTAAQDLEN